MPDDPKPDALDGIDEFYARYLETCRCLGVEPVTLERAHALFDEWSEAIKRTDGRSIDFNAPTLLAERQLELQPHLAMPPRIDATERFLL